MSALKILVIPGSLRSGSLNAKLGLAARLVRSTAIRLETQRAPACPAPDSREAANLTLVDYGT